MNVKRYKICTILQNPSNFAQQI